ncbi:MAG: hypothetical protein RBG13Loki_0467 [Promethearchaeota archaeon CR_4]|nr:MAG: hypothetical protein RBG13Loki_0467 [Candidatus Lokiarchaeota archaeon CR_4]
MLPKTFPALAKGFAVHCILVLVVAAWALLSPIYEVSTSAGEIYALTASGWVGDTSATFLLGITATSDYTSILWAIVITAISSAILFVTALAQKQTSLGAWGALVALVWVPVIVTCYLLGTDGFPMPTFSATDASLGVSIVAGWSGAFWMLVVMASPTLGGAVAAWKSPPPSEPTPESSPRFLASPDFHCLQTELAIRQSYARSKGLGQKVD